MPIKPVNDDRSGIDGIDFDGDKQTWIVHAGVYVWGSVNGASSTYKDSTLINNGNVLGAGNGVDLMRSQKAKLSGRIGSRICGLRHDRAPGRLQTLTALVASITPTF